MFDFSTPPLHDGMVGHMYMYVCAGISARTCVSGKCMCASESAATGASSCDGISCEVSAFGCVHRLSVRIKFNRQTLMAGFGFDVSKSK